MVGVWPRLIAGGVGGLPSQALKSADVFSPFTWEITPTKGQMSIGRQYHTATLLRDSSVLIAGGDHGGGAESSVEVYDRDKETFQPGPYNMTKPRDWHPATGAPDGNVLIVGGWNDNEKDLSSEGLSCELAKVYRGCTVVLSAYASHRDTWRQRS